MKLFQIKNIGLLAALAFVATACSDDDDWTPGPVFESSQVSFTTGDPDQVEVELNEAQTFSFTLTRDDYSAAASVPIVVSNSQYFEAPSTVEFAAGEETQTLNVQFKGSDAAGVYTTTVGIEEGAYNSPYTAKIGTVTLSVLAAKWNLISDEVWFYNASLLEDWTAQLYQLDGQNIYRFKNFMQNYDLTFKLDENGYITPQNGSWYSDYWYFGPDTWNESFPMYLTAEEGYVDWCFLYGAAGSSYNVLYPDGDPTYDGSKWGYICMSYSKYDAEGNYLKDGYDYIYISIY
jgi:hypothetical protein